MRALVIIVLVFFSHFSLAKVLGPDGVFTGDVTIEGAGDAGGGGPTKPESISVADVSNYIENLMPSLLLSYLNEEHYEFSHNPSSSSLKIIFNEVQDIPNEFKKWKIELESSKPCYDKNGIAKYASASMSKSTICFSASLLSQTLDKSNYQEQILALFIHEVGHLYGADEEQAIVMQKYTLNIFEDIKPQVIYDRLFYVFPSNPGDLSLPKEINKYLSRLEANLNNIDQQSHAAESVGFLLQDFLELITPGPALFVNKDLLETGFPQRIRMNMLGAYYKSMSGNTIAIDWLNKCFAGADSILVGDCLTNVTGHNGFQAGYYLVTLHKPTAVDAVPLDVKEFRKYFDEFIANIKLTQNISFNITKK